MCSAAAECSFAFVLMGTLVAEAEATAISDIELVLLTKAWSWRMSADHGRIDEPGEIVCAGLGPRGLRHEVDLPGRPGHRRANRGDFRVDSQGPAHSCRRDCGARCARRR